MGYSRKDPYSPHGGNFCRPEGGWAKKLFRIIVNVLEHPKGVGVLTSYFLCGGGMDVFWNDPMQYFTLDSSIGIKQSRRFFIVFSSF